MFAHGIGLSLEGGFMSKDMQRTLQLIAVQRAKLDRGNAAFVAAANRHAAHAHRTAAAMVAHTGIPLKPPASVEDPNATLRAEMLRKQVNLSDDLFSYATERKLELDIPEDPKNPRIDKKKAVDDLKAEIRRLIELYFREPKTFKVEPPTLASERVYAAIKRLHEVGKLSTLPDALMSKDKAVAKP